jgi:predicted ATP-grasp superfamily ATP-dependent carboligase
MKPIILIGLTPQGLSMLRLLARAGFRVIAFTNTKQTVGYESKYGEKYLFGSAQELQDHIAGIVDDHEDKLNCIIASGELLALILSGFPELYEMCEVQSGPYPLIKMLSNKKMMYDFAQTKGFRSAKHTLLIDYEKGELKFPVILKRNVEVPLFFKTKKVDTKESLNSFIKRIDKNNYRHILVQEFIIIKNFKDISLQAYLFRGEIKATFLCYQERRLKIGITSFLKEIDDEKISLMITQKCRTFFEETEYTGFCEFEFMYDLDTEELYFIEINTRTCGLHSAFVHKFSDLHELYHNIDHPPVLKGKPGTISWINIARDIKARFQNKDIKNLSQFFTSKYDILDFSDLKTFFYQFVK